MFKVKLNTIFLGLQVFLLLSTAVSAQYLPLLWERPIYNALNSRDEYFTTVGIKNDRATLNMLLTSRGSNALKEQLVRQIDNTNPWYHFLSGVVNLRAANINSNDDFIEAIRFTNDNPGVIWVMFLAFFHIDQEEWADKCLSLLEKHLLSIGAQSAPIVSQQLLAIALSEKEKGNNLSFRKYAEWSARFEQYPVWQKLLRGLGALPQQPQVLFNACSDCLVMLRTSWFLQLSFLYYLYRWLKWAFLIFIFILFIVLTIELVPIALHPLTKVFPQSVNPRLKNFFIGIMFVSLSAFGLIPFLLFATMIFWPYAQKWQKKFLTFCFIFLTLAPLDARIQDMFRVTLSSNSSLGVFRKTISEGWHSDLEEKILENLADKDSDYLTHISAALLDLKKESIASAMTHIMNAEKLKLEDPVLLNTAGNIFYAANDFKFASLFYEKCVEIFPFYAPAKYNLGQLNFYMKKASSSTGQMSQAADLNPDLINSFNKKNTRYFADTLPLQRQFLQADYQPLYFWSRVLPSYWGSWKDAKKIWGYNSFGLSPLFFPVVILLSIFLLLILVKLNAFPNRSSFCKLCGCVLCNKCKIGQICQNCRQILESTHEEGPKKQLKSKIQGGKERFIQLTTLILNGIFPGAGEFYREKKVSPSGSFLLFLTSCIYATYIAFFTFDFLYPFWVAKTSLTFIFLCLLVYNLVFLISSLKGLLIEFQLKEEKYVISWKSQ